MSESEPGRIEVVGLGPGDPGLRTVAAQRALDEAERVVLRTRVHPGLEDLLDDPRVEDCDDLYERGDSFDEVYEAVARRVCELAAVSRGPVVFAVPGHPRFGERSVRLLEASAAARGIPITVHAAVSTLDVIAAALAFDPLADEVQLVDAIALADAIEREPFAGGLITVDPSRPCLVGQVYAPHVATAVKLGLGRLYPDDHQVVVVWAAGVAGKQRLTECALYALDRQPVDHLTSVWVPPLPPLEAVRFPQTLARIVSLLRAPGGCPWDRKQSHASLRQAVIEEAYETVDAIDAGDAANLAEELGDLLLQVALHAQIAEEAGEFSIEDVFEHVARKLVRRHPHVFGDVDARTPEEVVKTWEAVKSAERAAATATDDDGRRHPYDRLPRSMPALQRAQVLLGPRNGELPVPAAPGDAAAIGESLLAAVMAATAAGVDPERALAAAVRRQFDPPSGGEADQAANGSPRLEGKVAV